jgi:hypothetical protein
MRVTRKTRLGAPLALLFRMHPNIRRDLARLRQLDLVHGQCVSASLAWPASQPNFELPDRRLARTPVRTERKARAGLAAVAFNFEPAKPAIEALPDRWLGLRRPAEAFPSVPTTASTQQRPPLVRLPGGHAAIRAAAGFNADLTRPRSSGAGACWPQHGVNRALRRWPRQGRARTLIMVALRLLNILEDQRSTRKVSYNEPLDVPKG